MSDQIEVTAYDLNVARADVNQKYDVNLEATRKYNQARLDHTLHDNDYQAYSNAADTASKEYKKAGDHLFNLVSSASPKVYTEFALRDTQELIDLSSEIPASDLPGSLKEVWDMLWGKVLLETSRNETLLEDRLISVALDELAPIIYAYKALMILSKPRIVG